MPMVMPPCTWFSKVSAVHAPGRCPAPPGSAATRTSPVRVLTSTSAKWAANGQVALPAGFGPRYPTPTISPPAARAPQTSVTATFFAGRAVETISPSAQRQVLDGHLQLLGRHREQLLLHVERRRAHRRRLGRHGLAAAAGRRVLRRPGVGVLDLDPVERDAELLGDDHRHDRLGPGADVARAHVEVDAAVGEELHDDGGRRPARAALPQAGGHADAAHDRRRRLGAASRAPRSSRTPSRPRARHSVRPVVV